MRVMAAEAANAVRIHEAGNEVVALHAILVGGPSAKCERCLAEFVLFQFPKSSRRWPIWKPTGQS
jgi:hypothetical protein